MPSNTANGRITVRLLRSDSSDQLQHHLSRHLAVGGAAQHEGELVGDQHHQQHQRHHQRAGRRSRAARGGRRCPASWQPCRGAAATRARRRGARSGYQGSGSSPYTSIAPAASRCCSKMAMPSASSVTRCSTRSASPVSRAEPRQLPGQRRGETALVALEQQVAAGTHAQVLHQHALEQVAVQVAVAPAQRFDRNPPA